MSPESPRTLTPVTTEVWHGIRDCAGGDLWGASQVAVILLGLAVVSVGYCAGPPFVG